MLLQREYSTWSVVKARCITRLSSRLKIYYRSCSVEILTSVIIDLYQLNFDFDLILIPLMHNTDITVHDIIKLICPITSKVERYTLIET